MFWLTKDAKHVFGAMKVEAAHFATIKSNCSLSDIRLEASNLVAKEKQNMSSLREGVKSAV